MTVQELLHKCLPRLKGPPVDGMDIFQAVNTLSDQLFALLVSRKSDLAQNNDGAVTLAPGEKAGALPADFRGLVARPYLADGSELDPIAEQEWPTLAGQTGPIPQRYFLVGFEMRLFPYPSADDAAVTVQVRYWQYPPAVSTVADAVPFGGILDRVYLDLCPAVLTGQAQDLEALSLAVAMKLDALLTHRNSGRRRVAGLYF